MVRFLMTEHFIRHTKRTSYIGIFKRIMASYPLDYYWLWTPEDVSTTLPKSDRSHVLNETTG